MAIDKRCIQQVLGCLIQRPQLLSEVDKYSLDITDFSSKFEKFIFSAINGLYRSGAPKISIADIENFLSTNDVAANTFTQNNGIEYLQDILNISTVDNFSFYYSRLKKFNLLRDLQRKGIDTSKFYIEDLANPQAFEVNEKFEDLSIQDIINEEKKTLAKLESSYVISDEVETWTVADEIDNIIDGFGSADNIGYPIQGTIFNHIINGAERGALTIRSGSSGLGKALPNSTRIPTPNGWKRVDEVKVGDCLFDAFGKPTRVLNVYPQGVKKVFEIKFKDGRTAKCCDEHLWSYNTCSQKNYSIIGRKFYTKTLKEIMEEPLQNNDGQFRILVPQQYAVEYKEQKHWIPSYVFGLALGDGSFRQHESNKSFQFSSEDEYLPNEIAKAMNWKVKKNSDKNFTWYFAEKKERTGNEKVNIHVSDFLIEYPELIGVKSEDKFIPRDYIEDSIENRFALLNGLLDSDGSVDKKGRISYFTISQHLRDNVVEIAQSLGFKTHIIIDSHKATNKGYIITITGRPEDKIKLFKLPRKHNKIMNWFNSSTRKESNLSNPIVEIIDCGYEEEMTCFYVDNDEHLFLTENFVVTHNTRRAVADACFLAYPIRYNISKCRWEVNGSNQKVLFIATEQKYEQVMKMIVAYLTGINESKFKAGIFTDDEKLRISQAKDIIKAYKKNFILVRVPNPTIDLIKTIVREQCLMNDIDIVFYDYIFIGPALLNEFRGFNIRQDEALLMFATALKDLAVELNVSVFTSTQVNAKADENRDIRNEASLAGGRATINKADNGCIMARPTNDELDILYKDKAMPVKPNIVTDIFKVRSGQWTQVRVWSYFDGGTLRNQDLLLTDSQLNPINDFFRDGFISFDSDDNCEALEFVNILNEGLEKL